MKEAEVGDRGHEGGELKQEIQMEKMRQDRIQTKGTRMVIIGIKLDDFKTATKLEQYDPGEETEFRAWHVLFVALF